MKKILLIISLIFLFFQQGRAEGEFSPPKGKIKGSVADATSKEPLEYATVALYSAADGKLITGTVTDYLGHFKLDQPANGDYYLLITFIGLSEQKTDTFKVTEEEDNINIGHVFLEPAAKELGEVEVVAKQPAIEYKIDKKVINVDKQITAQAGSAVDVLESVPSVQVDIEGNVSLRGSTGFTVLIDGKPTILDPSDALRQIPASSIENIEIITNPSVKYQPDGATGIINIITKKNRLDGLTGIANANAGIYGQYGGDFQLSYRVNKVNFIFGADYNKRPRPGDVFNERLTTKNDTLFFVNSNGSTERQYQNTGVRAGIEYDITKNDFISLSGRMGRWNMDNHSTLRYDDWNNPETYRLAYNSFDQTTRGGNYYSIDGVYQHIFKKNVTPEATAEEANKGGMGKAMGGGKVPGPQAQNIHSLKIEYNHQYRNNDEYSINELRNLSDSLLGGNKNVEKGPSYSDRINIDYSLPVGLNDKFEAGFQWRNEQSTDITELWLYNALTSEIELLEEYSNLTEYYRKIYAVYGLYAGMVGKFGYQAGLRGEYTDRKIVTTGEQPFIIDRWDFFPTVHLSYNLPLDQQLMASYARRIDRPRSWWLEPFITWEDAYNVRTGNPDLLPEYIDSYDMGYLKKFGDNFFSLEGYYRVTHNKVERVSSVYQENVIMHRPENVGQDYSLGLEAMFNYSVTKWWNIELSGNFFNYKLEGQLSYLQDEQVIIESINRSSTNWNSRFNNTFRLWNNGEFQINTRYNSASVTAQGTSAGFFNLDAAFKVTFLNRSLSANLQGMDLLGTTIREYTSEGPGFKTHYKYDPRSPNLVLSISYRFNNFKASRRASQSGGGEEF